MSYSEIDEGKNYTGFGKALSLVRSNCKPVGIEELPIDLCNNRILAENLYSLLDNPSTDVSLKDGFAVRYEDIATASTKNPVCLKNIGSAFAGTAFKGEVPKGCTVNICSGAPIPEGTDTVIAVELCEVTPECVRITKGAKKGQNILAAGKDLRKGEELAPAGRILLPGDLGLIASAGISSASVYRKPKVAIIAIGDEVVAPGGHLHLGQLYASNLVTIAAWLDSFGFPCQTGVVKDDRAAIRCKMEDLFTAVDVILTSGGAWGSERDLTVGILDEFKWHKKFSNVRMGPGKGVSFGLWNNKPVFCLPGGPASNEMAFLQLALPGILRMEGQKRHPLPTVFAKLTKDVTSRHRDWAEFKSAVLAYKNGEYQVTPYQNRSRLQSIANATCFICIPEGFDVLSGGDTIEVQLLTPSLGGLSIVRRRYSK
ncbi:MAG: molybdopterin molybdotransferase MoeA [Dehalococcoidales bacterium]|nr:molybdopterin molybdotransferase MoeA [Dehalococcoidales bacterium]